MTSIQIGAEARNQQLRRADWRFLTSTPAPDVSVTFGDGVLCDAVRAVSRRTINGAANPEGCADLAVASDPDPATLAAGWRALGPGGSLYTEWSPKLTRTPAAIRRTLERAGFRDVHIYAAAECVARPSEALLPVGAGRAIQWHLRRTQRDPGIRGALSRTLRSAAWRAAGTMPLSLSMRAIARKGPQADASFEAVRQLALQAVDALDGRDRDARDVWVLLAPGASVLNKVVLLALGRDGAPRCAIKSARTATAAEGIRREAAVLEQVHARGIHLPGVPRVLLAGTRAGVAFVAETPIDGVPVSAVVHGDVDGLVERAAEWQSRLVDRAGDLSRERRTATLRALLDYADRQFGLVHRDLVQATRAIVLSADRLPITSEQRDFSPWNVFVTNSGELAAVDWESGDACGWPALDLIYFLTYVSAYRERAHTRDGLLRVHRASLSDAGEARRITARGLERYAALSGIPRDALPPLRALCWLVHSYAEDQRLTRERGAAPAPGELRDSLFAALWEQELRATRTLTAA